MKKKMEILLGTTKDNGLVFGEYRIREDLTFSMSFTHVTPETINFNNESELVDRMEDYIECHDSDTKLQWLIDYDCSPSQLPNVLLDNMRIYDIIETFYDTSCYSETFEKGDSTLLFTFSSAGQYDCRRDIKDLFISKELFDTLLKTWDEFHLKELTPDALLKLESLLVEVENQDIDEIVENWVDENEDILY